MNDAIAAEVDALKASTQRQVAEMAALSAVADVTLHSAQKELKDVRGVACCRSQLASLRADYRFVCAYPAARSSPPRCFTASRAAAK